MYYLIAEEQLRSIGGILWSVMVISSTAPVFAQGVPLKIQICTNASQIAGDIAKSRLKGMDQSSAYALVQNSGLPLAQTTRLQGLINSIWNSTRDAQDANAKLSPAQIQNDYYLTCTR